MPRYPISPARIPPEIPPKTPPRCPPEMPRPGNPPPKYPTLVPQAGETSRPVGALHRPYPPIPTQAKHHKDTRWPEEPGREWARRPRSPPPPPPPLPPRPAPPPPPPPPRPSLRETVRHGPRSPPHTVPPPRVRIGRALRWGARRPAAPPAAHSSCPARQASSGHLRPHWLPPITPCERPLAPAGPAQYPCAVGLSPSSLLSGHPPSVYLSHGAESPHAIRLSGGS